MGRALNGKRPIACGRRPAERRAVQQLPQEDDRDDRGRADSLPLTEVLWLCPSVASTSARPGARAVVPLIAPLLPAFEKEHSMRISGAAPSR